jgi:hypothetical protein
MENKNKTIQSFTDDSMTAMGGTSRYKEDHYNHSSKHSEKITI